MFRLQSAARPIFVLAALLLVLCLFGTRPAFAAGVVGTGTVASCTQAAFDAALGGGVYGSTGKSVINSSFSGNQATFGAGIYADGRVVSEIYLQNCAPAR